jgi:hypothetical protein
MKAVYAAFPGEGVIHQDVFVKALRDLQRTLRR